MSCSLANLESESCKFNVEVIKMRILICEYLDLLVVPKIICMDHIYNSYIVQMLQGGIEGGERPGLLAGKKVGVELTSLTKHRLVRGICGIFSLVLRHCSE